LRNQTELHLTTNSDSKWIHQVIILCFVACYFEVISDQLSPIDAMNCGSLPAEIKQPIGFIGVLMAQIDIREIWLSVWPTNCSGERCLKIQVALPPPSGLTRKTVTFET